MHQQANTGSRSGQIVMQIGQDGARTHLDHGISMEGIHRVLLAWLSNSQREFAQIVAVETIGRAKAHNQRPTVGRQLEHAKVAEAA